MKDDAVYIRHIRDCIRRIQEDTACGRDRLTLPVCGTRPEGHA